MFINLKSRNSIRKRQIRVIIRNRENGMNSKRGGLEYIVKKSSPDITDQNTILISGDRRLRKYIASELRYQHIVSVKLFVIIGVKLTQRRFLTLFITLLQKLLCKEHISIDEVCNVVTRMHVTFTPNDGRGNVTAEVEIVVFVKNSSLKSSICFRNQVQNMTHTFQFRQYP